MKKQFRRAAALMFAVMTLTACSSSQAASSKATSSSSAQTETAAYEVPKGFTDGYVYGEYSDYADADKAESLKGTHIWIDGAITLMQSVATDSNYVNVLIIQTEDGDKWEIIAGTSDEASETLKDDYNYAQNGVCVTGIFVGFDDDSDMPCMIPHQLFTVANGQTTDGFPDYEYTEAAAETENTPEPDTSAQESTSSDEVSADFRQTMDEYEAFFDSYVEFMKTYEESDDTMSMLTDYMNFLTQYTQVMNDLDSIDESSLSAADDAYYLEVMLRINQKLAELY